MHEKLIKAARAFIAPYTSVSQEFLREMAEAERGTMSVVGSERTILTTHVATSVLAFRAAIARTDKVTAPSPERPRPSA